MGAWWVLLCLMKSKPRQYEAFAPEEDRRNLPTDAYCSKRMFDFPRTNQLPLRANDTRKGKRSASLKHSLQASLQEIPLWVPWPSELHRISFVDWERGTDVRWDKRKMLSIYKQ